MQVFDFNIPSNLKFGLDVVNRIGNIAGEFGNKVILVTEGILHENKLIERVETILKDKGCEVIIFDEVVPFSMSDVVDYGTELTRASFCDVVVGLGGIRTLSIAKAIAMLSRNNGDIAEYIDGSRIPARQSLPYIEIPSTPRNPFMFKNEFLITDIRFKTSHILKSKDNGANYILYDPIITTTMPRRYTATTILDILSNAIEGYISTKSNFLSDILFLKSINIIGTYLFTAINNPDDVNSRAYLSLGGLLTSLGLNMSSTGITSALTYVLNAKYKIHKSLSSCVILPHVMDFNITAVPSKLVKIAEALGENVEELSVVEASIKAVEKVRKLIIELELPVKLEEFEINKDEMINVADDARRFEMFNYLPRTCSSEELYAILQAAY